MSETVTVILISLLFIFLLIFPILAYLLFKYNRIADNIKEHSKLYNELLNINMKYAVLFHDLEKSHNFYFKCNSLSKFKNNNNHSSIINYLCEQINNDYYIKLRIKLKSNKINFNKYQEEKHKGTELLCDCAFLPLKIQITMRRQPSQYQEFHA